MSERATESDDRYPEITDDTFSSWSKENETSEESDIYPEHKSDTYDNFADLESKPTISEAFLLPAGDSPLLELADCLGYDSRRRKNLQRLDKDTLLFVAGNYVRLHKLTTKENIYIRSTGGGSVSCLAVHSNREHFASGERGKNPDINVFAYPSCRLTKVLRKGTVREYVCLCFDPYSGDLLASQGGEPDFSLIIWDWRKETPLLKSRSFSQDVYSVSFNEELYGFLATTGMGHIRFWRMATTFTGLKLQGQTGRFGSRDVSNIEACVQLADGKVLSGCEEGTLLLWEEALLMAEFSRERWGNCHCGNITQMMLAEGEVMTMGEDGYIRSWHVDKIVFVDPSYAGQSFHIEPLHEWRVTTRTVLVHMVKVEPENQEDDMWYVQDQGGMVWSVDLGITSVYRPPKVMLQSHGGPVTACAVSPCSHLVATTGQDGSLRVFDCLRMAELFSMTFTASATALLWLPLSVDSRGAAVVVGFDDGIIRKIAVCEKTILDQQGEPDLPKLSGKLSQVFKPHKGRVTSLAFSPDGDILASGGSDNTLFLFNIHGTRFEPVGWSHFPTGIRQLVWTPRHFSHRGLLAACEQGQVVEVQLPDPLDLKVTANFQLKDVRLKLFVFRSVKSEIEHVEEVARRKRERAKAMAEWGFASAEESGKEEAEASFEEEDDWEPFIPEPPCPILQAVYSSGRENHFWLTLGDYDAGYVYLCEFPEQALAEEGDSACRYVRKPVKVVAVPNCSGSPVSVLRLDTERRRALLGFGNGHLRIVQLAHESELDDLDAYWDLSVHDDKLGSLTGLEFAFDDSFLITTGMDGNIMVFSHAGRLARVNQTAAALPVTVQHHTTCSEDLPSQTLWFPDAMDKQKHEKDVREAEESKKRKRNELKELQKYLKSLHFQNQVLPKRHRLSREEMLINLHLYQEHEQQQQLKLAELRKQCAWHSEKLRLLLQKAQTGLHRLEELPHQFAVVAFGGSFEVRSYRVPTTCPKFQQLLEDTCTEGRTSIFNRMKAQSFGPATGEYAADAKESATDIVWRNAYDLTRRRSTGLTGTASRSLRMALDKANRAKQKRFKRQREWERLHEEKAFIDKDDPADIQAIKAARDSFGDIQLKTDMSRAVQMAEDYSHDAPRRRLARLEKQIRDKTRDFNKKLMRLREEKYTIVRAVHVLDGRLGQVSHGIKALPVPLLSRNEYPDIDLAFDEQILVQFRKDFTLFQEEELDAEPSLTDASRTQNEKKPSFRHTYYKGERSDYPDIVKFVLSQTAEQTDRPLILDEIFIGRAEQSEPSPSLRRDINMFSRLQIEFEESFMSSVANGLMDDFDDKLRNVRKERFHLDSWLKQADLAYIALLEECLIDQKTSEEEGELKKERMTKERESDRNETVLKKLQEKIAIITEESEEIAKQSSDLFYRFKAECTDVDKEGDKRMRYLALLYKRKVSRKKDKPRDDDEEYDSDEESSNDSCSLMSVSDSASSVSWDPDVCPDTLDRELYDTVLALQAQRQDLDDRQDELKRELASLNKELEMKSKEADILRRAEQRAQESMITFYQEKITLLNEIDVVVMLLRSRIYVEESCGLVMDLQTLRQLHGRTDELTREIRDQEENMNRHTNRHLTLCRANRLLKTKVDEWKKKCEEEVVKKFGKPVSLIRLQLVTVNPKVEMLNCRLLMDKEVQEAEERQLDRDIEALRGQLAAITRLNTTRYLAKAEVTAEKNRLEHELDTACKRNDFTPLLPQRRERLSDREKLGLTRLVQIQAEVIGACWSEINFLEEDDVMTRMKKYRLPRVSRRHCMGGKQATANNFYGSGSTTMPRLPKL